MYPTQLLSRSLRTAVHLIISVTPYAGDSRTAVTSACTVGAATPSTHVHRCARNALRDRDQSECLTGPRRPRHSKADRPRSRGRCCADDTDTEAAGCSRRPGCDEGEREDEGRWDGAAQ